VSRYHGGNDNEISCEVAKVVLQQLHEPEPARAELAQAGPGSSLSRAEPWELVH